MTINIYVFIFEGHETIGDDCQHTFRILKTQRPSTEEKAKP